MKRIEWTDYAFASLLFSLATSLITTVHHLHSVWALHPDSGGMHVVWLELVLFPLIVATMIMYLRSGSRVALAIYLLIAAAGFVFLGLFEGGWNHTVKLLAYLRIDSAATHIGDILPADNWHLWFYEITGVATFIFSLVASWYTLRFFIAIVTRQSKQA